MAENYVSRRDKIVASAVELIGDLGLNALTTKNLARKENISETLIYKYFGGIDEVLTEVVVQYAAFDKNIQMTVDHQAGSNMDKLRFYADTYATYYDNYIGMGAIMLHYEELLHLSETRELTLMFNGIFTEGLLERRTKYSKKTFRVEVKEMLNQIEKMLRF